MNRFVSTGRFCIVPAIVTNNNNVAQLRNRHQGFMVQFYISEETYTLLEINAWMVQAPLSTEMEPI